MFLKNEIGEIVNLNKVVAINAHENILDKYGKPGRYMICLHTENDHVVKFNYENRDEFVKQWKAIQTLLIKGPKYNQRPWTDNATKWITPNGSMLKIDEIECILVEGWAVDVFVADTLVHFYNHNDAELDKCLDGFDFNLRGVGRLINLDGWKAEG